MVSSKSADGVGEMKRTVFLLLVHILAINAVSSDPTIIRKRVSEVQMMVVATDSHNRPLLNLSPADITVLENGLPVSQFDLRSAGDLPLRLGIVLDLSDSTKKTWPIVRSALNRSLSEAFRPHDQFLLMTFNSKIETEHEFTEPSQFSTMLENPAQGGLTALYDTVYRACKHQMFLADSEPHRSAMILLSDGEDDISLHDPNDAIDEAQLNGIAIYTVATHDPRYSKRGDEVLHLLAASTGGRDFVVKDSNQLQLALATVNQELRSSYVLYYHPLGEDGRRNFRRVYILSNQDNGSHMRARIGYYTKP
jgi:Ca-activated chloride channel homolog